MWFLSLMLLGLSGTEARVLPEFQNEPAPFENFSSSLSDVSGVQSLRVLIFPHFGTYAVPQGREDSAKQVQITTSGTCEAHEAVLSSHEDWEPGTLISAPASVIILTSGTEATLYYSCTAPFTLHRKAPLKSIEYSGNFVALVSPDQVRIVNIVDPETYLKGVIPSEVEASWPTEVLRAQAIAARTYEWFSVLNGRGKKLPYDLDDTVASQAYLGNSKRSSMSDSAADDTSRQVMTFSGKVIKAYFSADSGGFTAAAEEVFQALPYCQAKPERYDLSLYPESVWTQTFAPGDLDGKLFKAKLLPDSVGIKELLIESKNVSTSGRALIVTVLGTDLKTYSILGRDFRLALHLRSTLINKIDHKSGFVIHGRGFGHGVGMAQEGALQYSKQLQWNHEQILRFYYDGIEITQVNSDLLP